MYFCELSIIFQCGTYTVCPQPFMLRLKSFIMPFEFLNIFIEILNIKIQKA